MAGAFEVASVGLKLLTDEAAFRREFPGPVLVWESPPDGKEEPLLFATRPGERAVVPRAGKPVFFEVRKTVKNAFADEVTVGRTTNNDIVIEDNSVSRFHAYFAPGAQWSLVDAGSSVGSWVEGNKLAPRAAAKLHDQSRVRLGTVEMRFMVIDSFVEFLRKLAG
jgi:pSer/pThr/pTyr-binding forkhead associated (FHA) protein